MNNIIELACRCHAPLLVRSSILLQKSSSQHSKTLKKCNIIIDLMKNISGNLHPTLSIYYQILSLLSAYFFKVVIFKGSFHPFLPLATLRKAKRTIIVNYWLVYYPCRITGFSTFEKIALICMWVRYITRAAASRLCFSRGIRCSTASAATFSYYSLAL